MSAFLYLRLDDRIELLADGAVYMPDGTLVAIAEKIRCHTALPVAVAGRGDVTMIEAAAESVMRAFSIAGSVDAALPYFKTITAYLSRQRLAEHQHFELLTAFMSESCGPSGLYFSTFDGTLPACTIDVPPDFAIGGPDIGSAAYARLGMRQETASAGFGPCAVPIMEALRQERGRAVDRPELPALHGIGGHIQHAMIDQTGARSKIIHKWPDMIGETIKPDTIMEAA